MMRDDSVIGAEPYPASEDKMAYIKRHIVSGAPVFTVYSSSGDELASFDDLEVAVGVTLQNNLVPVSVH